MADIDKVKILVLGDSGVGKTSLTHLICHNQHIKSPAWTVGCSVEVKLHEFREGLPQQKTFFIELWDIGGSSSHRNTRSIFYNQLHGVLLVHDLSNRKSQQNLGKWLADVLNTEGAGKHYRGNEDFDAETMLGASQIPILVIGTKLDLAGGQRGRGLTFAEECGAQEITLNCHLPSSLAAGSSAAVKLSRFFDRVIETKFPERVSPLGKISSQCAHAAVGCYKNTAQSDASLVGMWEMQGQPKIVLRANGTGEHALTGLAAEAAQRGLTAVLVRDSGRTEVAAGSATVLGIGPGHAGTIDQLTKTYRLF